MRSAASRRLAPLRSLSPVFDRPDEAPSEEHPVTEGTAARSRVPLVGVQSVPKSVAFYSKLGFAVANTFTADGGTEPVWAELTNGGARLMISRNRESPGPGREGLFFYLYTSDVSAFRAGLLARGVEAGVVEYPFWAPRGEFRVEDPDGYVLMVTHT